ncbi:hypothetical protein NM688_g6244 [Phlebia brevispora]|uniref:Uncharacterized protein n=1 Tax=Phlebia brevispora TaxID=194682 RepID=A0ACC1SI74_9APHY|nr:hypothetical protein NM688_g6244 [Phlebia brevispora]
MASSNNLQTMDVVVDTPRVIDGVSVKMAARRYAPSGSTTASSRGLTLVFGHGIGSHKEQWEPVIETLYKSQAAADPNSLLIREIWTIDFQDHGDSATLNEVLFQRADFQITSMDWAEALADFCKRMNSTRFFGDQSSIPYESLILVEPTLLGRSISKSDFKLWQAQVKATAKGALKRRDEWDSYEAALAYCTKRFPWTGWDPRVVKIFVEKGLRPIREGSLQVTLKCPKPLEAQAYDVDPESLFLALDRIQELCDKRPIHVIFGEIHDFIPEAGKLFAMNLGNGRKVKSVSWIPKAGHFIHQQQPDALAQRIWQILVQHESGGTADLFAYKSRL